MPYKVNYTMILGIENGVYVTIVYPFEASSIRLPNFNTSNYIMTPIKKVLH